MPVIPTTAVAAGTRATPEPTAVLTRALREGDEAAWREFYSGYSARLLRYLLVVCGGDEFAAREAMQTTFLRCVRHIRVILTEEELWSWLTVLARGSAVDAVRRERRYLRFLNRWFENRTLSPAPSIDTDLALETALSSELEKLPSAERALLERKYLDGDAVRVLADSLGTSEKAIESRLTRARQRLKSGILSRLRHEQST